jgi:septal ring factor EnvC (AmiA/AmiB activator)
MSFEANIHHWVHHVNEDLMLKTIHHVKEQIMSAIEDLKATVETNNAQTASDLAALTTAVSAELQQMADTLAGIANQDPVIMAVTEQLRTAQAGLHAGIMHAVDALNTDVALPPAP